MLSGRTRSAVFSSGVPIVVNGEDFTVPADISIGAALSICGVSGLRLSSPSNESRGIFCGMGSCQECVVNVDGNAGVRACITPVSAGIRIEAGRHEH